MARKMKMKQDSNHFCCKIIEVRRRAMTRTAMREVVLDYVEFLTQFTGTKLNFSGECRWGTGADKGPAPPPVSANTEIRSYSGTGTITTSSDYLLVRVDCWRMVEELKKKNRRYPGGTPSVREDSMQKRHLKDISLTPTGAATARTMRKAWLDEGSSPAWQRPIDAHVDWPCRCFMAFRPITNIVQCLKAVYDRLDHYARAGEIWNEFD